MTRSVPRRIAIWVAIFCLAITVVALGAAAKRSQFESAAHSTSYLTQSVKMVAGNQLDAPALPPWAAPQTAVVLEPPSTLSRIPGNLSLPALPRHSAVCLPLLV